jgi:F-type H+-transporting ATPase subunit epsilon
MSQEKLQVTIAKVSETLFEGVADSLKVPGADGEMEILAHHEPLISTLKTGTITLRSNGTKEEYKIDSGVLEVSNNRAVVLV